MNRITLAIAKVQSKVDGLPKEQVELHSKDLDMCDADFRRFQMLKSAYMGSAITEDEAITIYGHLGNTPEHFNKEPLAVKFVLTRIYGELLMRLACTKGNP